MLECGEPNIGFGLVLDVAQPAVVSREADPLRAHRVVTETRYGSPVASAVRQGRQGPRAEPRGLSVLPISLGAQLRRSSCGF